MATCRGGESRATTRTPVGAVARSQHWPSIPEHVYAHRQAALAQSRRARIPRWARGSERVNGGACRGRQGVAQCLRAKVLVVAETAKVPPRHGVGSHQLRQGADQRWAGKVPGHWLAKVPVWLRCQCGLPTRCEQPWVACAEAKRGASSREMPALERGSGSIDGERGASRRQRKHAETVKVAGACMRTSER